MKLFHYTIGIKLESIFFSGVIRTSPQQPRYPEKPIAWLSSNEVYEKTALKIGMTAGGESQMMTLEQMDLNGQGLYRFVFDTDKVEEEILHWPLLKTRSKAKPKVNKRLLERAKLAGVDPMQWYGTLDQELPINTATLEKAELLPDGTINWVEVENGVAIDSERVLEVTVQEAKQMGLGMKCTNNEWGSVAQ